MMKMSALFLALLILLFSAVFAVISEDDNLKGPEKRVLKVKGTEYVIDVYRYDPPYLSPPYLIEDPSQADCSTPESSLIAISSAAGRNIPWYLSLFDEYTQKWLKEKGWLSEDLKGKTIGNPIQAGNYIKYLYKVKFNINGNDYQMLMGIAFIKNESAEALSYELFIKQDNNRWLKTLSRKGDPLQHQIGLYDYDELMKISWPFDEEKK